MSGNAKKRICIIDDEAPIRTVLIRALGDDYDVEGYESAEDAMSADVHLFDLVLTDVRLPGISGIELISELKKWDESLPVILMTGMSDFNTAVSAIREGASDFIVKPFIIEQLLVSVQRAIERRQLVLENKRLFNEIAAKNLQLEDLNREIHARNLQMESDVDIAGNLLESIFPRVFPDIKNVHFCLQMKPYERISGDFFEVIPVDENRFMFIIADVCGHGVPAALYSALIKSTMMVEFESAPSISDYITQINEHLISSHKMLIYTYVAMFCGMFDIKKRTIQYCNAGVPAPLIISADGKTRRMDSTGTIVGIFTGAEYQQREMTFDDTDRFVFFTDGAFEGLPVPSTQKGYENLVKHVEDNSGFSIDEIVGKMFSRLTDENGNSIIRDDVTIIGMEISST